MNVLLTTFAIFLPLSGLLRGLRHPLYGLHVAIVAVISFCVCDYWLGEAEMFAKEILITIAITHIPSINLVTYLAYYFDKRASRRGTWRISERTLHQLALIGGSPAAMIAQKRLRHKTQKHPFKLRFWATVIAQILILIALLATISLQSVA